jgi:hypothetical protein
MPIKPRWRRDPARALALPARLRCLPSQSHREEPGCSPVRLNAEWSAWVATSAASLHRHCAWRLTSIVVGILLASGRRTVASWFRAAGIGDRFRSYSDSLTITTWI